MGGHGDGGAHGSETASGGSGHPPPGGARASGGQHAPAPTVVESADRATEVAASPGSAADGTAAEDLEVRGPVPDDPAVPCTGTQQPAALGPLDDGPPAPRSRTRPAVVPTVAIVVVTSVLLRLLAVLGHRSYRYVDSAEYEVLDFTGRSRRGWTTPLLYRLVPDLDARVLAQASLGGIAFAVLALVVGRRLRLTVVRWCAMGAVVALGASVMITNWDTAMLSESTALSCTALLLAAWLWWCEPDGGQDPRRTVAVVGATVAWLFSRQNLLVPSLVVGLVVVAAAMVAALRFWVAGRRGAGARSSGDQVPGLGAVDGGRRAPDRVRVRALGALAVALVVVNGWAVWTYGRNTEIVRHNITTVIANRLTSAADGPTEGYRWLVADGMPEVADGRPSFTDLQADADFQAWLHREGTTAYVRYLLHHPWVLLTGPVEDLVSSVQPFGAPEGTDVAMLAPDTPYGAANPVLPRPVESLVSGRGSTGSLLALVVVAAVLVTMAVSTGVLALRRCTVPLVAAVASLAGLWAAWHGSSGELERLGVVFATAFRLAVFLVVAFAADAVVAARVTGDDLDDDLQTSAS